MLQKKFEKLPGLSNVSGKYTKKTTSDAFSRPSVLESRCTTTTLQGFSAQEPIASTSAYRCESDDSHRYRFGSSAVPSSCSVPQLKDTVNRPIDRRRSQIQMLSTRQSSTNVSSPSWPSSLSSVSNDRRFPSSNLPTRTSENIRRVKKASEIVKSSSSGSVASLSYKPTGIILGTSSVTHGLESGGSPNNTHATVSRPHTPSTPYPVRQSCMSPSSRDVGGLGSSSSFPFQHSREKRAENSAVGDTPAAVTKPMRCTRPSVLVRPMNAPVQASASTGGAYSPVVSPSYTGVSFNRAAPVPWKRHVYVDSGSRRRVCSPSSSQVTTPLHGPRPTHEELNSLIGAKAQPPGLISSRSISDVPWLFNSTPVFGDCYHQDSRIHNNPIGDGDLTSVSSDWSHGTPRSAGPVCHQCKFNASPQSLFSPHFCEPPYSPCGSIGGTSFDHPEAGAMPGPQYTQCALQQYLADLITGESSHLLGESTNAPVRCSDRDEASLNKNSSEFGTPFCKPNDPDYQGVELLRCLENKIQNALRNVHNSDTLVGTFENINLSSRGSRGRSISFSSGSPRFAFPSGATTMHSLGTISAYDSQIPEKSSQPEERLHHTSVPISSHQDPIGSFQPSHEFPDHRTMLDQFNENELRYLLKAVQDMLALRSQTSRAPGGFVSLTSVKPQHHSQSILLKPDEHLADEPYKSVSQERLLGSQMNSRSSSSSVRNSGARSLTSAAADKPSSSSPNDATAASTPGVEYDSSPSDLMHRRLPLGFQHFKRYLDNKFGPDKHLPPSPSLPIRTITSASGHLTEVSTAARFSNNDSEQPISLHSPNSSCTNSALPGEPQARSHIAESTATTCRLTTGSDTGGYVSLSTDCLTSSRGSFGESQRPSISRNTPCLGSPAITSEQSRSRVTPAVSGTTSNHIQLATGELARDSSEAHFSATSPCMAPSISANILTYGPSSVLQCYDERGYPPPQQFDLSPPLIPHTPYLPCHQKAYGSNPEVTETHQPNVPADYSARSRWSPYMPQCYWWPHPAADHSSHNSWFGQFGQEQLNMAMLQFPTNPQETCPCGMEFHQINPYAHWLLSIVPAAR